MNWKLLKQKYPNSYSEIREWFDDLSDQDWDDRAKMLLFFKAKGYESKNGFIRSLKHYEQSIKF